MYDEGGQQSEPETGWAHVATHDEAAPVIDAVLRLDPDEQYTKTELSEAAGVALKTLYLDGTLDHLVTMGFLDKHDVDGEETTFFVDDESDVYQAAMAFDDAVLKELQTGG